MEERVPLIIDATLEEDQARRLFFSCYEARRGSQESIVRIPRNTTEPEVLIKPMKDPKLEQMMIRVLLGNTFSEQFQEAFQEFAEGMFQAGIDYAERKKE
jgi:hypothetical protein